MTLTKNQKVVLDALAQFGPAADCVLTPIIQHVSPTKMSSSGVRSRRAELCDLGLVQNVDTIKMPSGRSAVVWAVKS